MTSSSSSSSSSWWCVLVLLVCLPLQVLSAAPSSLISSCDRVPDSTARGHFSYYEWGTPEHPHLFQEYCAVPEKLKGAKEIDHGHSCRFNKMKFSQCGQDAMVAGLLKHKKNGYFIDIASNHWCFYSNSLRLERVYGWKGVCVEGNAGYMPGLVRNRTCDVVSNVVSKADNEVVTFAQRGVLGGIVAEGMDNAKITHSLKSFTTVSMTTIANAMDSPGKIDYMSLDVEGAEAMVLQGFDLKKYTVTVMTVERPSAEVHRILAEHGYWFVTQICGNMGEVLYLHQSYTDLNDVMSKHEKARSTNWKIGRGKFENHVYLLEPAWTPIVGATTGA